MSDETLVLRPLTEEDAAVSWRWRNDPEIWKLTIKRPTVVVTEEIEREWIRKVLVDPTRLNFAICVGPNRRYIGNAYIVNIRGNTASPSVFIGEGDCRGIGLGTRVLTTLRAEAFRHGITELRAHVRADNVGSLLTLFRNGGKIMGVDVLEVAVPCAM